MNQIKSDVIKTINAIPDEEITTFEELLEAICIRHQAMEGLKDIENDNVLSLNDLRKDVANWK